VFPTCFNLRFLDHHSNPLACFQRNSRVHGEPREASFEGAHLRTMRTSKCAGDRRNYTRVLIVLDV
jgi:hypothetical protein